MTIEAQYGVPTVAIHTDKFDRVARSVAAVNGTRGELRARREIALAGKRANGR